jgi:hypothetical protein
MEESSRVMERIRIPLVIPLHPYLKDHHFEGKIILPAVDILQWLARSVQTYRSDASVKCMRSASFDRFLHIENDSQVIETFHEMEIYESGRIYSKLITIDRIRGAMTRTKVHAAVNFMETEVSKTEFPLNIASAPDGICYCIPSHTLYNELVPFGPSYQNVIGDILLSESGAAARVHAADHPALSEPLGSPFPFDGALHVACAWGQRFHHIVAFPVGFKKRLIVKPTVPGETYRCRIMPISVIGESLLFDIWIHGLAGGLREEIRGVIMRDVSGGRVKPPDWILYKPLIPPLEKGGSGGI